MWLFILENSVAGYLASIKSSRIFQFHFEEENLLISSVIQRWSKRLVDDWPLAEEAADSMALQPNSCLVFLGDASPYLGQPAKLKERKRKTENAARDARNSDVGECQERRDARVGPQIADIAIEEIEVMMHISKGR